MAIYSENIDKYLFTDDGAGLLRSSIGSIKISTPDLEFELDIYKSNRKKVSSGTDKFKNSLVFNEKGITMPTWDEDQPIWLILKNNIPDVTGDYSLEKVTSAQIRLKLDDITYNLNLSDTNFRLNANMDFGTLKDENDKEKKIIQFFLLATKNNTDEPNISFSLPKCEILNDEGNIDQHKLSIQSNGSDVFLKSEDNVYLKWSIDGEKIELKANNIIQKDKFDDNAYLGDNKVKTDLFNDGTNSLKILYSKIFPRTNNPELKILDNFIVKQVSDEFDTYLYVVLQNEKNKTLIDLWNTATAKVSDSRSNINKAQSACLTPKFENSALEENVVLIWRKINSSLYDFKEIIFKETNATLQLQNINISGVLKDDKNNYTLTNIKLSQENIAHQNDNGTIFSFNIYNQDDKDDKNGKIKIGLNTADKLDGKIIDGSFEFTLDGGFDGFLENNKNPIDDKKTVKEPMATCRLTIQLKSKQKPLFLWQYHQSLNDDIEVCYSIEDFKIPVSSVRPIGQDLTYRDKLVAPESVNAVSEGYGERPQPALIIPLDKKVDDENKTGNYFLSISESINVGQDFRVEMCLKEYNTEFGTNKNNRIKAIVLDSSPQNIALIDTPFLLNKGIDDGVTVLARKSGFSVENGTWELFNDRASKEGFNLILPTQAIGESFLNEKNYKYKIEGQPISFEFGAPALVQIANENTERAYVTPAWNLRNIWGEVGDNSVGLPLLFTQFELLYGLMANFKPTNAAIFDIAAKLGYLPNPPFANTKWQANAEQLIEFNKSWAEYLSAYRAWIGRLSVMQVSERNNLFATEFKEFIKYFIRKEENSYSEREQANGTVTSALKITNGAKLQIPFSKNEVNNDQELLDIYYKYHNEDGLDGGFHYGFENAEIYKDLWSEAITNKGSSSGEIKNLAFSSLGGWGEQTARFDKDKTIIKSHSAMGRTHFYAVERIGRIGVLWNKAKHVIEYERTVVPSEQFQEIDYGIGRPIARKVREYIEILEPIRRYPDFEEGKEKLATGSIMASHFKTIKIPISSTWGRNMLGNIKKLEFQEKVNKFGEISIEFDEVVKQELIGWEVPLWNPDADPNIYPLPQLAFEILPTPGSELKEILCNVENLQNIYFYTDYRDGLDANTENWPRVPYLDFTNLPYNDVSQFSDPYADTSKQGLDTELISPVKIVPGFERFTFVFKPSDVNVALNARHIPTSTINGKISTVMMMRGELLLKDSAANKEIKGVETFNKISDKQIKFENGNSIDRIDEKINKYLDDFGDIQAIADGIEKKSELKYLSVQRILGGFEATTIEKSEIWLGSGIDSSVTIPTKLLWDKMAQSFDGYIGDIDNRYSAFINTFNRLQDDLDRYEESDLEELKKLAKAKIDEVEEWLEKANIDGQKYFNDVHYTINRLLEEYIDYIKNLNIEFEYKLNEIIEVLDDTTKIENLKNCIESFLKNIQIGIDSLEIILPEIRKDTDDGIKTYNFKDVKQLLVDFKTKITGLDEEVKKDGINIEIFKDKIKESISVIKSINHFITQSTTDYLSLLKKILNEQVKDFERTFKTAFEKVFKNTSKLKLQIEKLNLKVIKDALKEIIVELKYRKKDFIDFIIDKLLEYVFVGSRKSIDDVTVNEFSFINQKFKAFDNWLKEKSNSFTDIFTTNNGDFKKFKKDATELFKKYQSYKKVEELLKENSKATFEEKVSAVNRFAEEINEEFGKTIGVYAEKLIQAEQAKTTFDNIQMDINNQVDEGNRVLTNYRTLISDIQTGGLGLNRKTVAMVTNFDVNNYVPNFTITPVMVKVQQLGDQLQALGIRLPSFQIDTDFLDAFNSKLQGDYGSIVATLKDKLDFSKVLSGIGGFDFDNLFPGFKFPSEYANKIKITKGFDKKNLKAWLKANVDFEIAEQKTLMSFGLFKVTFSNTTFYANMNVEVDADGKITKTNQGSLQTDIGMEVQGQKLMTFKQTIISFVNDRYNFDLDPSRMEMSGLLKLVTDATKNIKVAQSGNGKKTSGSENAESSFSVNVLKEMVKLPDGIELEIPYGMEALFNIAVPQIGGGTSSLINLNFGAAFLMKVFNFETKQLDFNLALRFYMSSKAAPFNFAAFIFGGGGYIDCLFDYTPAKTNNGLSVAFAMSIQATASLAFNAGWIKGYVMLGMGIEVVYKKLAEQDTATTSITMFVQMIGCVIIIDLVDIYLMLRLETTYDGYRMIGRGMISVEIEICWLVSITVVREYEKVMTGSNQTNTTEKKRRTIKIANQSI